MKRLLLFVFFLPFFSFAQNDWAPVNPNSKYNYKLDTANYITHTIWVESTENVFGFNIYTLNTIVKRNNACDSILQLGYEVQSLYCSLCKAWKNQPQFLQKQVIQIGNGDYIFYNPNSILLKTKAQQGATWFIDSTNTVSASIILVDTLSIFGIIDSVKTILLSTGDTIKITKEHGILLFPDFTNSGTYYKLVGMENPDLGEIVPGFWEMYDYNVGGAICHNYWGQNANGGGWATRKNIIISKEILSDRIKYGTNYLEHVHSESYPFGGSTENTYSGSEYLEFIITENYYNNELVKTDSSNNEPQYYFVVLYKSNSKYCKQIGSNNNPGGSVFFIQSPDEEDLLIPSCDNLFSTSTSTEGIGLSSYSYDCNFECAGGGSYYYTPENWVNPTNCLSDFTSIEENEKSQLLIFPNPTTDFIYLKNTDKETAYKILDNTGRTILSGKTEKVPIAIGINVQTLSPGYYRVVFEDAVNRAFIKL